MDKKTASLVSYITIIGWLVAFFTSATPREPLLKYHLKQSFGMFVLAIIYSVIINIVASLVPAIAMILSLTSLVFFIFMILGAINAYNEKEIPLPIIGKMFENKFNFIK